MVELVERSGAMVGWKKREKKRWMHWAPSGVVEKKTNNSADKEKSTGKRGSFFTTWATVRVHFCVCVCLCVWKCMLHLPEQALSGPLAVAVRKKDGERIRPHQKVVVTLTAIPTELLNSYCPGCYYNYYNVLSHQQSVNVVEPCHFIQSQSSHRPSFHLLLQHNTITNPILHALNFWQGNVPVLSATPNIAVTLEHILEGRTAAPSTRSEWAGGCTQSSDCALAIASQTLSAATTARRKQLWQLRSLSLLCVCVCVCV